MPKKILRRSRASPLVVVRLTPPGRGAIATVLVEGPGALAAVEAPFRSVRGRLLTGLPPGRLAFGHFGPEPGEEVVVRVRSGESVEVHCHGGRAAVAMVEQALVDLGCRPMDWRRWARQRSEDPIAADAWIALAEARTERTAAILLDQHQGALSRAILAIQESLAGQDATPARQQIAELLARAPLGLHLVRPWRVVVAGAANVGKSSLVNALLGYPRAIVDPAAGTTRDVVTATTAVDGWPVELCDTAGLRPTGHPVEQAGIESAQQSVSAADLVLLVFDLSQPWTSTDQRLLEDHPAAVLVHNKADLEGAQGSGFRVPGSGFRVQEPGSRVQEPGFGGPESSPLPLAGEGPGVRAAGTATSALYRTGIDDLLRAIAARLVPAPPEPGAAVPFTQDQVDALVGAFQAIASGDIRHARLRLDSLCHHAALPRQVPPKNPSGRG
jgi:tRNA modification GTPase